MHPSTRSTLIAALVLLSGCGPAPRPALPPAAPPPADGPPVVASMDPAAPHPGAALRQVLAEEGPDGTSSLAMPLGAALTGDPAAVEVLVRGLGGDAERCEAAGLAIGFLPRPLARRPLWVALRTACGAPGALVAAELLDEEPLALRAIREGAVSCSALARAVGTGMAPALAAELAGARDEGRCGAADLPAVARALAATGDGEAFVRAVRASSDPPGTELPVWAALAFQRGFEGEAVDGWIAEVLGRPDFTPETSWAIAAAALGRGEAADVEALGRLAARACRPECAAAVEAAEEERCAAGRAALHWLARRPGPPPSVPGLEGLGFRLPESEADLEDPRVAAAALRLRGGDGVVRVALELGLGSFDGPPPALLLFVRLFHLGGVSERLGLGAASGEGELCAALAEAGRLEPVLEALLVPSQLPGCTLPAARALASADAPGGLERVAAATGQPGGLVAAALLLHEGGRPPRWTRDAVALGQALAGLLAPLWAREGPTVSGPPPGREIREATLALAGVEDVAPAAGPPTLLLRDLRTALPAASAVGRRDLSALAFAEAPTGVLLDRLDGDAAHPDLEAAALSLPSLREALLRRGRPASLATRCLAERDQDAAAGVPLLASEEGDLALAPMLLECDAQCAAPLLELAADATERPEARRRAALVLASRLDDESLDALGAVELPGVAAEVALARWVEAGLSGEAPGDDDPRVRALALVAEAAPEGAILETLDGEGWPAPGEARTLWALLALSRLAADAPASVAAPAAAVLPELVRRAEAEAGAAPAGAAAAAPAASDREHLDPGSAPAVVAAAARRAAEREDLGDEARRAAVEAVSEMGRAEDAVFLVARAAGDEAPAVRAAAVSGLAGMPARAADRAVAAAAADPEGVVRLAAARAAVRRGLLDVAARVAARDRGEALLSLSEVAPLWALPVAARAAASESEADRLAAVEVVLRARTSEALALLQRLLGDGAPRVRARALRAAVDLGARRALGTASEGAPSPGAAASSPRLVPEELLAEALRDGDGEVRLAAAEALVALPAEPPGPAALVPLLRDADPRVAALARQASARWVLAEGGVGLGHDGPEPARAFLEDLSASPAAWPEPAAVAERLAGEALPAGRGLEALRRRAVAALRSASAP